MYVSGQITLSNRAQIRSMVYCVTFHLNCLQCINVCTGYNLHFFLKFSLRFGIIESLHRIFEILTKIISHRIKIKTVQDCNLFNDNNYDNNIHNLWFF